MDIPEALARAHATERRLMETICEVHQEPDYAVYRSPDFPSYYDGNLLELSRARARSVRDWQRVYWSHFDRAIHDHVAFRGLEGSGIEQLVDEARGLGYEVERDAYLVATEPLDGDRAPLAPDLIMRRVDSEARWRLVRAFDDVEHRAEPWYTPAAADMLFEKTRRVSRAASIEWLYVSPRDTDQMLAKLGLFEFAPPEHPSARVCRLQDVVTAATHRRRGLATALVAEALREALVRRGCTGLYVCADTEYIAIDLYRTLGFRDVGISTRLLRVSPKARDRTP